MLIATKMPIPSPVLAHMNVRFALRDNMIPLPGSRSAYSAASPMNAKTTNGRNSADPVRCHCQTSVSATNTAPKKLMIIALRLPTSPPSSRVTSCPLSKRLSIGCNGQLWALSARLVFAAGHSGRTTPGAARRTEWSERLCLVGSRPSALVVMSRNSRSDTDSELPARYRLIPKPDDRASRGLAGRCTFDSK